MLRTNLRHTEEISMKGSSGPLTGEFDVALLDLDGVVYVGEQAIDGVPDALASARDSGLRLAFVTNNASRTPTQVAELLQRVGVPASPDEVITSSHAAAHELADMLPEGAAVLVLGTTGLIEAVRERGLVPVFSADDGPQAVVQGYSPDLDWRALAEGAVAIRHGVPWVATNLDATVPSPRGPLPGNGSLVAALRHATDVTPTSTGKPDPRMHAESVQRSGADKPLVVGDRLDTDIEGARRVGCPSLLVLSGVTTVDRLFDAEPLHRPDFIGHDVSALLLQHPEVHHDGASVRCGGVVLTVSPDEITLAGSDETGDRLDAVRAIASACWRLADAGLPRPVLPRWD
jgi:HAD superfamily hydrolase (TIGR01450 family)